MKIESPKMPSKDQTGFFVMPFGIDGVPVDRGFWEYAKLSSRWLAICKHHVEQCGPVSDTSLRDELSHVRIKMTSASGAALMTVYIHGKAISSLLLLGGQSPSVDNELARMYVTSLQKTGVGSSPGAFTEILSVSDRPILFVVHWPETTVSEDDNELVRELALHFAGAFFMSDGNQQN